MTTRAATTLGLMLLLGAGAVISVQAWLLGSLWYRALHGEFDPISPGWFVERALITLIAFYPAVAIHRLLYHRARASLVIWLVGIVAFLILLTPIRLRPWFIPSFVAGHFIVILYLITLDIRRLCSLSSFHEDTSEQPGNA